MVQQERTVRFKLICMKTGRLCNVSDIRRAIFSGAISLTIVRGCVRCREGVSTEAHRGFEVTVLLESQAKKPLLHLQPNPKLMCIAT